MNGIIYGSQAMEFLAATADADERSASSHWREMHRGFRYRDGRFEGLRGFGGYRPRPGVLRRAAHRVLQRPFRALGHRLSRFEDADRAAAQITERQERLYDLDALRQALTAALLLERIPGRLAPGAVVAVIGDGFGMLSALLLSLAPGVRVVAINLAMTLLVDLAFLLRGLPELKLALATDAAGVDAALGDGKLRLVALRAEDAELLGRCPIDLAANVVSMQEMDPPVIAQYFDALRAVGSTPVAFYCCNRLEKALPDGTVVRFREYPWSARDDVLLDEPCPWSEEFYTWWPPFYRPYDGPIWHRLALLAKA
ncbi:MAG: putative sugar O-methyltransferase [Pseudomonadota bacterium]